MSSVTSPSTSRPYGVTLVCRTWDMPRSTYYLKMPIDNKSMSKVLKRRGPKPKISDEQLLKAIEDDLARSPFKGEGHRKVHARLRILDEIRVSRTRVLRLMRERNLLSPHRVLHADQKVHDGKIVTDRPNEMWGTDGVKIFTVEDGWVWIFSTIEHWNAECVGWHVCKRGTRYNALEAVRMGIEKHFGSLGSNVAHGLALRMDHGSQYLSDHFRNQIRFWGITPSWAFVEEPQTNGVAERFNRTMKEQAIYGRVFRNVEEVRTAVEDFIERYNEMWRVEKLGFCTPAEARRKAVFQQVA